MIEKYYHYSLLSIIGRETMDRPSTIDLNRSMMLYERAVWEGTTAEYKKRALDSWFEDVEYLLRSGKLETQKELQRVYFSAEKVLTTDYSIFYTRCFVVMGLSLQEMIRRGTAPDQRIEVLSEQAFENLKIQRRFKGDEFSSVGMMEVGIALMMIGRKNQKQTYLRMARKCFKVGIEYAQYSSDPYIISRLQRFSSSNFDP
jgi:hypothetical protein